MSWWGGSSDAGAKEPAKEEVWDLTSHDGIDEDQYALDSASSSVNHDPFADELSGEDTSSMDFTHSVGNRVSDVYEGLHSMPAAPMPTEGRVAESAGAGRGGGAAGLLGGLNPAALQAMAAQQQQQQQGGQDRFLQQSRKGLWEVTMHNVGVTYLSGVAMGSFYGIFEGAAKAPKRRARIVLNSVLNAVGKRGSGLGNAIGTLALLYSATEWGLDYIDFDMAPDAFDMRRREIYTQMAAAAITAGTFRLPQLVARRNLTGVAIVGVSALMGAGLVAGLGAVGSAVDKKKTFIPVNWEA
ncbi:tim23 [Symbiodinium sp. KB8]|nr:tim23 [Symbiodinium sp. KB8]